MSNQHVLQWPEICRDINKKIEPLFGGHNYIFRPIFRPKEEIESFIFIASEKRMPISGIVLPKDVTVGRTKSGVIKIVAKNPASILEVILAAKC